MANSKKKGNLWENRWAKWLREHGISANRNSSSGAGVVKSDVTNDIDINFEVKSGKQVPKKVYDFYEQSVKDADMTHNTPYVVMHRDGRTEDEFLIVMNNYDWLDLWRKAKEPKTVNSDDRELKWSLKVLKDTIAKILKILDK